MNIHFNVCVREALQFFQQTFLNSLTAQQKKVLLVASTVLGLLTVYSLIKYCCFKTTVLKKTPDEDDLSAIFNKIILQETLDENDPSAPKKQNPQAKTEAPEMQNGDDEALDPALISDENQKDDEDFTNIPDENLSSTDTPINPPTSNPSRLTELAKQSKMAAEMKLLAIDWMLQEGKNLSDEDKESLLKAQQAEIERKDLMQSIIQFEREEYDRLQKKAVDVTQQITKIKTDLDKKEQLISQLNKEMDEKEQEIQNLTQKINLLSQGMHEWTLAEFSCEPDTLFLDEGVKAGEFIGKRRHTLAIDKRYNLISETQAAILTPKGDEYIAVARGTQSEFIHLQTLGNKTHYSFMLHWKGDGVMPQIKINWLMTNADFNEATIINTNSKIKTLRKRIQELKEFVASNVADKGFLEKELTDSENLLDLTNSRLEKIGNPT